jgi:3-dehydroquinate synthase
MMAMVQRKHMSSFEVRTADHVYPAVVERGSLRRVSEFVPARTSKIFVLTTEDVWRLHSRLEEYFPAKPHVMFFRGGENNKRLSEVERLAEELVRAGADRKSLLVAFGGGIVNDVGGFLAAIFMRGIPVLQVPTTLLAQVDAAVGGKTGVNLASGKNLIGSFHQPAAVLIDPDVLGTLPEREYRAGLFEIVKAGIILDSELFDLLEERSAEVIAKKPEIVDELISASVRIKADVVSKDEKEADLRRILNFGHTAGHALEAETAYVRLLHGEAVAWGMLAETRLAELAGKLEEGERKRIARTICRYGPLPAVKDLDPDRIMARFGSDKKTLEGRVHFVLPVHVGQVEIVSGVDRGLVRSALVETLQERQ